MSETWFDGICKKCNSAVIETGCRLEDLEAAKFCDYKNRCSNEECEEYFWHYVGDQEFLDYYEHKKET